MGSGLRRLLLSAECALWPRGRGGRRPTERRVEGAGGAGARDGLLAELQGGKKYCT